MPEYSDLYSWLELGRKGLEMVMVWGGLGQLIHAHMTHPLPYIIPLPRLRLPGDNMVFIGRLREGYRPI